MSVYLSNLQKVIRQAHRCSCLHVATEPVVQICEDRRVWRGNVEVFDLHGHPSASRIFAWGYDLLVEYQYVTILKEGAVEDASQAVRAALKSSRVSG